jgi:hypothetical protein
MADDENDVRTVATSKWKGVISVYPYLGDCSCGWRSNIKPL